MSGAVLSRCGRYRYALTRRWEEGPEALFIMLNPSIADASIDDPTLRRCIGFARREGCGGVRTVNLFAWRATSPKDMAAAAAEGTDIVGRRTASLMREALRTCDGPVIAAWGSHALAETRAAAVMRLARREGRDLLCLGITAQGHPRHPLYVRRDAPLVMLKD